MRRGVPTFLGYLSAVALAIAVTDLGLVADQLVGEIGGSGIDVFLEVLLALMFGGVYVAIVAVPTAVLVLPGVHLVARRLRTQEGQVLVSGLAGALAGAAWAFPSDQVVGLERTWLLAPLVGVACAVGRASIIPWVPWLPVDDDSRPGVPAC